MRPLPASIYIWNMIGISVRQSSDRLDMTDCRSNAHTIDSLESGVSFDLQPAIWSSVYLPAEFIHIGLPLSSGSK